MHYGTPVGFRACVYDALQRAHARTSQSPSKCLNTLIRDAYMGKPLSLGNKDPDDHTVVTMHIV